MADITDFQIGQGETFKIHVRLLDQGEDNSPIDITNYTFTGQVRENYTTDELATEFIFTKALPYTSGSVYMELSANDTINLTQRKYVYDVKITSGSVSRRILEGGLTIRPAVTR